MINVNNLSYKYDKLSSYALKNINLSIKPGEFVLICGNSGSGKSTLARLLCSTDDVSGVLSGSVERDGLSSPIGYLAQDVDAMIVCEKVWQELAFGLENQGKPIDYISRKVAETASYFDIADIFHRELHTLSGGTRQIVELAAVMTISPDVIILDEPLSMLDPSSCEKLISLLNRLNEDFGTTVIVCEHRLTDLIGCAHRLVVLEEGKVIYNDMPDKLYGLAGQGGSIIQSLPEYIKIFLGTGGKGEVPLSISSTRKYLTDKFSEKLRHGPIIIHSNEPQAESYDEKSLSFDKKNREKPVIELKNVSYSYENQTDCILKDINLNVNKGEIHYIIGANGSGKTTLLLLLAGGLSNGYFGKKKIEGSITMLTQNPRTGFCRDTIYEELVYYNKLTGSSESNRVDDVIEIMKLEKIKASHPYDVSGGEIERAALAKVLLAGADIILLDEPTKGMDGSFLVEFREILNKLKEIGKTIVIVSHDLEFAASTADTVSLLFDGKIVTTDKPRKFFTDNRLFTTSVIKTSRGIVENAIYAGEVCRALTDDKSEYDKLFKKKGSSDDASINNNGCLRNGEAAFSESTGDSTHRSDIRNEEVKKADEPKTNAKKTDTLFCILFALTVLIFIPLIIYTGMTYFDNRRYTFISLSVLFAALTPSYITFERRGRSHSELVIIATMSALTVISRVVFYMLPNFKPVISMVTISGLALGPFDGFMVGMLSMLVSNIIFMQGPWTPWQMFAMGMVGLAAGLLGKVKIIRNHRLTICIAGGIMCFIIYGAIMNPASVLMYQGEVNKEMILAAYAAGFPYDCIQAAATFIFLYAMAKPFLRKLERAVRYF